MIPSWIIELLKKEPVKNSNILYFLEDNIITGYHFCGNSVLISGISDREWFYFASSDEEEFLSLIQFITPGSYNFTATEKWMVPILLKHFSSTIELTVVKLYLPPEIILPEIRNSVYKLTEAEACSIIEKSEYKEFLSIEYIKDRIRRGVSAGIYNGDELIGWAITHDDGAIGFLHVDEKYRSKGLGSDLTIYMSEKVRLADRIPFVHIEKTNLTSLSIAKKLGFVEAGEVSWLVKTNK
jgi:8-oxo-dGTP diphosphatase